MPTRLLKPGLLAVMVAATLVAPVGAHDGGTNQLAGPRDPYRGIREDPVAGVWFPAMVRELADNARP